MRKGLQAKHVEMKETPCRLLHVPVPERSVGQAVRRYLAYHAVPLASLPGGRVPRRFGKGALLELTPPVDDVNDAGPVYRRQKQLVLRFRGSVQGATSMLRTTSTARWSSFHRSGS
jgi:hypothetical protein